MKTIKTLLKVFPILLLSTAAWASHERTISNICQELWKSGKIQFFPSKICSREETSLADNAFYQSEKNVTVQQATTRTENLSSNNKLAEGAFAEHMPPVEW